MWNVHDFQPSSSMEYLLRRTLDILTFPISLPSSKRLKTDGNIETLRIFSASLSSRSKKTKSGFHSGFPGVQESRAWCGPCRQRIKPFSSETAPTRLAVPAAIRLTNLMPFADNIWRWRGDIGSLLKHRYQNVRLLHPCIRWHECVLITSHTCLPGASSSESRAARVR